MESPAIETPMMEQDDIPIPCKGCGEILEEGKAFELAGQRWHIDCFRCSNCSTLLDSDAHLLLLGDGSLICSKCTYNCSSCGNKIEDLAILTGDQAFCAQCFRCRNCKKKIENLRYARTSQGIFCMDCHESLMQRRRKRTRGAASKKSSSQAKLDKSLPSLPPHLMAEAQNDAFVDSPSDGLRSRDTPGASDAGRSETSPSRQASDSLILPSSTYRSSRQLTSPRDAEADGGAEFLIPLAFDPSTEGTRSSSRAQSQQMDGLPRDYFGALGSGDSSLRTSRDGRDYLQDLGSRASSENHSPHIAYQDARRDLDGATGATDKATADTFKAGQSTSARSSTSDIPITLMDTTTFSDATSPESNPSKEQGDVPNTAPLDRAAAIARPTSELRKLHEHESGGSSRSLPASSGMAYPPKRGDSLETKSYTIPRKEIGLSSRSQSTGPSPYDESPRMRAETPSEPPKSSAQNTPQLDSQRPLDRAGSPSRSRYNSVVDYPDEELASAAQTSESFLRRMSNSVRHGRSFSDKSVRLSKDLKSPRSPTNGSAVGTDISSPPGTAEKSDEVSWLRTELRKERQRAAEMEFALRATADVKQVNTELSEKRSTMVVLDAQREIVLRELTVLTEHLEAEKRTGSGGALDLSKLSNNVLRDLAEAIQKLKESYGPQIEELVQRRFDLSEELANLQRQKEKSFQEFEQLSSKNAQLAELNNQLVHQIQGLYKANDGRGPNGLGIYHNKEKSTNSIETFKPGMHDFPTSISTAHIDEEGEHATATATIVPGPQVVSIRKGQPRKFNWKKGGQNVAKGVKGLKGAFMSNENEGGLPRSQTQDPSRQGFGFFGNQRNRQVGKMSHTDSVPVLAEGGGLFGTDLEDRMVHEKSIIPAVVTRCIQEVELRGMDMEGIYRKSGAASVIQGIREGFERSPFDYDLSDPDLDIHAVTSALKQYFRKLPTPLITYEVYEKIIESSELTSTLERVDLLQRSLMELPRVHRDVLEFLVFHLKRVVERRDENLMTSQNVAVVFAPTIMRPESLAREMTDVQKKNDVVKFLVDNCQGIFQGMQA
ncbi:uncharacterized protein PFLUO_LOCUS5236 [Penicillium psychrofluorescens]|uniref:uncharacterized protein n=1 Tax=Penicillium psychrofluorescens TaxID=3158075 RepID=UPI003CCD46A1